MLSNDQKFELVKLLLTQGKPAEAIAYTINSIDQQLFGGVVVEKTDSMITVKIPSV